METMHATAIEQKPLESIAGAVHRVNSAQVRIQSFINRFRGAAPEAPADPPNTERPAAVHVPYGDSLERLFAALDRLETRVEALDSIG